MPSVRRSPSFSSQLDTSIPFPLYPLHLPLTLTGPWATDTQLLSGVRAEWVKNNMPLNTPSDVAKYIIQVTAEPTTHGKALFVTGGNAVDIEEGLNRTEPTWLGEKNSRELNAGQAILGLVSCFSHPRLRGRYFAGIHSDRVLTGFPLQGADWGHNKS